MADEHRVSQVVVQPAVQKDGEHHVSQVVAQPAVQKDGEHHVSQVVVQVAITGAITGTSADAEVATASGSAEDVTAGVGAVPSTAAATGSALDVTAIAVSGAEAHAGIAVANGIAYGVAAGEHGTLQDIHANVGATQQQVANLTGESYDGAADQNQPAELATATGSANDATAETTQAGTADAEVATATGVANNANVSSSSNVAAGIATGAGSALDAAFDITTRVNAGVATSTWVANSASTTGLSANASAGVATGTGVANNAGVSSTTSATAEVATGTGAAYDAVATDATIVYAYAGTASGTGAANGITGQAEAGIGVATATGTAYAPTTILAASITGTSALTDAEDILVSAGTVLTPQQLEVGGAVIDLTINGTSVYDDTVISSLEFVSRVSGGAGTAKIRVRDLDSSKSYAIGDEILLTINDQAVWRGWVMGVKRAYSFPAENVGFSGLRRFWDIEGADINTLFAKRFAFKQSDPKKALGKQYDAYTYDREALQFFLANWIDLTSDDIDTSSMVEQVGYINQDQMARPWQAGMSFGEVMSSIASLPGAVFYLRPATGSPAAYLVYTDVDTPNAPFALSDTPDGSSSRGYRQVEVVSDASNMANDVLAWGLGYGSSTPVFKRETDSTSVTTHDTWQQGVIAAGVYKQGTIDRIANSIVYGSATSHRGAKDDRMSVQLTTFNPGLMPGDKVTIALNIYGYSDVLPIREMHLTFHDKTTPRYDLILSHEIDTPWSSNDPVPPFTPRTYDYRPPHTRKPKPPVLPPPGPSGCTDEQCGITDTFTRFITDASADLDPYSGYPYLRSAWGIADCGSGWILNGDSSPYTWAGVDGAYGHFSRDSGHTDGYVTGSLAGQIDSTSLILEYRFRVGYVPTAIASTDWQLDLFEGAAYVSGAAYIQLGITNYGPTPGYFNVIPGNGGTGAGMSKGDWVANTWYTVKAEFVPGSPARAKIWADESESEPDWQITSVSDVVDLDLSGINFQLQSIASGYSMDFDYIDVLGLSRCTTANIDNFDRTVASGWGTSSAGYTYQYTGSVGSWAWVDGTAGHINSSVTYGEPWIGPITGMSEPPYEISFDHTVWGWIGITTGPPSFSNDGLVIVEFDSYNPQSYFYITGNYRPASGGSWTYSYGDHGEPYLVVLPGFAEDYSDYDEPYSVKIRFETTRVMKLKAWKCGTTEPDWMMTFDMDDPDGDGSAPPFDSNQTFAGNDTLWFGTWSGQSDVMWDNINISYDGMPCFPSSCGSLSQVLDTFTRTESSGSWGTSDSGGTWVPVAKGSGTTSAVSVDGSMGILDGTAFAYSGSNSVWVSIPVASTWNHDITFQFQYTGTWHSFQAFMSDSTDPFTGFMGGGFDSAVSGGTIHVYADSAGSGTEDWGNGTYPTAATSTLYNCHMITTASTVYVNIWQASGSEPTEWTAWDTWTDPNTGVPSYFTFGVYGDLKMQIDNLSIQSTGCDTTSVVVIDDWDDRTLSLSHSGQNNWGNTSGTGDTWWSDTAAGDNALYGVSGGVGQMQVSVPGSGYGAGMMTLNEGGSDSGPWYITGSGAPDFLWDGSATGWSIDFMCDNVTGQLPTGISFVFADVVSRDLDGFECDITNGAYGTPAGTIWLGGWTDGTAGKYNQGSGWWTNNTWYTFKVQYVGSSLSVKIWERGTTEPGWQAAISITPQPWIPGEWTVWVQSYYNNHTVNFYFDNFVGYQIVDSAPASGGGGTSNMDLNGQIAEFLTPATTYTALTSQQYQLGTVSVYKNGTFLYVGSAFTLNSDLQTITFSSPISSSDSILVIYTTQ